MTTITVKIFHIVTYKTCNIRSCFFRHVVMSYMRRTPGAWGFCITYHGMWRSDYLTHHNNYFTYYLADLTYEKHSYHSNCWHKELESSTKDKKNINISPLSPNINIHVLSTILLIFLMLLVGRIWLRIKTFDHWWSFPWFSWPVCLIK